jgi:hypothetical protein
MQLVFFLVAVIAYPRAPSGSRPHAARTGGPEAAPAAPALAERH